jgi:hypothetical protein
MVDSVPPVWPRSTYRFVGAQTHRFVSRTKCSRAEGVGGGRGFTYQRLWLWVLELDAVVPESGWREC